MRICIHRGTEQIGGTCIEVEASGKRIVLDVGMPLDILPEQADAAVPAVQGFREPSADLLAALISHPHQDHVGLVRYLRPDLPVVIGAAAQRILDRAAGWLDQPKLEGRPSQYLESGKPLELGPFRVTPYLVDHSAYDAYALLIEAEGKRLFYSGDFRGHGRKQALFEAILRKPPAEIDVFLMEGTVIGRDGEGESFPTEQELETDFVDHLSRAQGLTLVWTSAQNIDRIVTLYRAAKRTGKTLILDAFTAEMLAATENPNLPQASWPRNIAVYVPDWMRRKIRREGDFAKLDAFRRNRIFLDRLTDPSRFVMLFRPGLLKEVDAQAPLEGAQLLYSNWSGYLRDPSTQVVRDWIAERAIPIRHVHTSGHASVPDLKRFAAALAPRRLVPIHSFHTDRFDEFFANVERRRDGEWWEV
jgi:ribonuclease J